jgi:tripartite-type tricarboxylate transporter receptor subunit TctC
MLLAALLAGTAAAPVGAQSYPDQPIRLVLATSPGGTTDIVGRIIAPKLAEELGQPVVIENRPGAGGNVGAEFVAKARPDGHTLLLANGDMGIAASLYEKLNFDPIKDLTEITLVAQVPLLMSVRPELPVKDLREFVQYAKSNPGKLNYASSGVGAMNHLAVEQLKSVEKLNVVHAPYKATGPGIIGLMGGEVDMIVTAFPSVVPHATAGKIKPLAMLASERSPSMPDVPTAKEAGMDNYEFYLWFGLLAPGRTPRNVVDRLNAAWTKVSALPDVQAAIAKTGCTTLKSTPEKFSEFFEAEVARWAKIIKEASIPRQ